MKIVSTDAVAVLRLAESLTAKGKLRLPLSPKDWFDRVVEHQDLTLLALALDVCIAATVLPDIHDDPCDRFIIATARLNDLSVVTADE